MDINTRTMLEDAGVDLNSGLNRFMGNEELYMRFLKRLPEDDNFLKIWPALMNEDMDEALSAAHTLKGVSGNLSVTRLFDACSNIVNLIRADKKEEAKASYQELEDAYRQICGVLEVLEGEN